MRRLLYVVLNDMIPLTTSSFIILNTVTKDLSEKIATFRCSSLRCLSRLVTPQIAPQVERFFKQTIVDSIPSVKIASLICCLKLPQDIVQKYLAETNTCIESDSALVQYHATRLFLYIKQNDQQAITMFITSKAPSIRSYMAQIELIRMALKLYQQNPLKNEIMINFIVNITQNSIDLIVVEALRALVKVKHIKGLIKLLPKLKKLIISPNTITKFAGVRIINDIANSVPNVLTDIIPEIESLLKEKNRAIVTLATSTALRIANEDNIDKLLKKISKFIESLPDGFRLQVLSSIDEIGEKYESKRKLLINFLGNMLKVKGKQFTNAVVTSILKLYELQPQLKEEIIDIFGEYIEDCQDIKIIERIIGIIGDIGPKCNKRLKIMRIIYNRLILEGPSVRAACISALYKFIENEEDIDNVYKIMQKCINDEDNEVRSRALLYTNIISEKITNVFDECIIDEYPLDNLEEALMNI